LAGINIEHFINVDTGVGGIVVVVVVVVVLVVVVVVGVGQGTVIHPITIINIANKDPKIAALIIFILLLIYLCTIYISIN
jgi:hypothetical protein